MTSLLFLYLDILKPRIAPGLIHFLKLILFLCLFNCYTN